MGVLKRDCVYHAIRHPKVTSGFNTIWRRNPPKSVRKIQPGSRWNLASPMKTDLNSSSHPAKNRHFPNHEVYEHFGADESPPTWHWLSACGNVTIWSAPLRKPIVCKFGSFLHPNLAKSGWVQNWTFSVLKIKSMDPPSMSTYLVCLLTPKTHRTTAILVRRFEFFWDLPQILDLLRIYYVILHSKSLANGEISKIFKVAWLK